MERWAAPFICRLAGFLSTPERLLSRGPLSGEGQVGRQPSCLHSSIPSQGSQAGGALRKPAEGKLQARKLGNVSRGGTLTPPAGKGESTYTGTSGGTQQREASPSWALAPSWLVTPSQNHRRHPHQQETAYQGSEDLQACLHATPSRGRSLFSPWERAIWFQAVQRPWPRKMVVRRS